VALRPKRSEPKAGEKVRSSADAKHATGKASRLIDERIRSLGGWRAENLRFGAPKSPGRGRT